MGEWLEKIHCATAREFIDQLRPTHPRWITPNLISGWIFRGVPNSVWELTPSAWRQDLHPSIRQFIGSSDEFENMIFSWQDLNNPPMDLDVQQRKAWLELPETIKGERVRRFVEQQYFEFQLLHDFWTVANDVGHPIAEPYWITKQIQWSQIIPPSMGMREHFFAHLLVATAQHHGIPTRLLDWTLSSLIAAFFATVDAVGDDVAVWALKRAAVGRTRLREYQVPRAQLPFLHAQSGLFVWDPWPNDDFAANGTWPAQEHVIASFCSRSDKSTELRGTVAYKVTLPKEEAADVVQILWRERISKAHLMPTFDSVAQTVRSTYGWRSPNSLFERGPYG